RQSVEPNSLYKLKGIPLDRLEKKYLVQLDGSFNIISNQVISNSNDYLIFYTLPSCEFISVTTKTPNDIIIAEDVFFRKLDKKYLNKQAVCFGDSITWYDGKLFGSECK